MFKTRLVKIERALLARGKRAGFGGGSYSLSKENGKILVEYAGADITGTNEANALIAQLSPGFISDLDRFQHPIEVYVLPRSDVLIIDDIELDGYAI